MYLAIALIITYSSSVAGLIGSYDMAKKGVPKMIRELRTVLGLTQEQFAAKVGVTFTTVNRWENNKAKPSPLALHKISALQRKLKQNKQSK